MEFDELAEEDELTLVEIESLSINPRCLFVFDELDASLKTRVAFLRNCTLSSVKLPPVAARKLSIEVCIAVQGIMPTEKPKFFAKLR